VFWIIAKYGKQVNQFGGDILGWDVACCY